MRNLFFILFVFPVLLLSSCVTKTKIEYRDRDVNHYITNTVHDTLRIKETDSVYHEIRVVNDTVYDTKYVERTRWKDRVVERHDTCFRDSVQTIRVETTKEVVKISKFIWYLFGFSIIITIFATLKCFKRI